jgi:hypothetical protein
VEANAIRRVCFSVALLLGVWSTNANAVCFNRDGVSVDPSKGPVIPWPTEFRQASVILIGTVVSEKNIPDPKDAGFWSGSLYTLTVEALLKGKAGTSVQVFSPNDSGRLLLVNGARYLVFLHEEGGHLTTSVCGNSAKLVNPFP